MGRRTFGDNASRRVLDQLKLMEGLLGEAEEERATIIDMGGDKTVDKGRGGVGVREKIG